MFYPGVGLDKQVQDGGLTTRSGLRGTTLSDAEPDDGGLLQAGPAQSQPEGCRPKRSSLRRTQSERVEPRCGEPVSASQCTRVLVAACAQNVHEEGAKSRMESAAVSRTPDFLFVPSVLDLGRLHWYLAKADAAMEAWLRGEKSPQSPDRASALAAARDAIYWWVFKRELNPAELRTRTEQALLHAQELKEAAFLLSATVPSTYEDLIRSLQVFAQAHAADIAAVLDYVRWLDAKDNLAPSIVYSYRVWGGTNLADRSAAGLLASIDAESPGTIRRLAEIALGLYCSGVAGGYAVNMARMELGAEIADSLDPEDPSSWGPVRIPQWRLVARTAHYAFGGCATYFERLRDSLRNVVIDIDKYVDQRDLMKSDSFWREFVNRAVTSGIVEPQPWGFKRRLNMWYVKDRSAKDEAEVEFVEDVAAFANAEGGVLVLGSPTTLARLWA